MQTETARGTPLAVSPPREHERIRDIGSFGYIQRKTLNVFCLGLGDTAALLLALAVAGLFRWWLKGDHMVPHWAGLLVLIWWPGALVAGLLPGWGLGATEELRRQVYLLMAVFGLAIIVLFLSKTSSTASRMTVTTGFVLGLPLVPLLRTQVKSLLIGSGRWGLPAVIYGGDAAALMVLRTLREESGLGYNPIGVFDDESPPGVCLEDVPVLGTTRDASGSVPVAIVAMPSISRHQLIGLLDGTLSSYRTIVIVPDLFEAPSLWVQPRDLRGILGLEVTSNLLDPFARFMKRAVDLGVSLATLPLWGPVCLLVAALVYLHDRKSPLYLQERVGKEGRLFRAWKFRTMHHNAETVLEERMSEDPGLREEWEKNFKLRNDPRVTPLGSFLRRTSLDELPQLVNVLRGEMSLVGPRPLPTYHYQMLSDRVRQMRDRVRPGITGLWQVSGRSDSGTAGMERWDTYYVRNWSIWLDVVILVRTFRAVWHREGAY